MALRRFLLAGVLAVTTFAVEVLAQAGSGRVTGLVRDPTGTPLSDVSVVATNEETNASRAALTTSSGLSFLSNLVPGVYRIVVEQPGFAKLTRSGLRLTTGEALRVDLDLSSVTVEENVTVTADAPILRTETGGLGQLIGHEKVLQLPLNGRNFLSLVALAPGVAMPPGQPGTVLPRINGGRPRTNEYLFDGISVLQPEPGQVAFFPVVDAIQEFKVESNSPPAEFGRFNGGVVNLTTRSGANAFHGTGFEFFRHEGLNARNYFARSNPDKPTYRRQQFGMVAGGPLSRNRTFFFVDYQGQRQTIGRPITSIVPTELQRQGVFTEPVAGKVATIYDPATTVITGTTAMRAPFAANSIPVGRFDSVAAALLARYPLPTAAGTSNNYTRVGDEVDNQDQADVRIDHRFGQGLQGIFGRLSYFNDRFTPVTPLPDGSGVTTGTLGPQDTSVWAFASSYQRAISDRVVNELRVGDTRRTVSRTATSLDGLPSTVLGLPGIPSTAQFPYTLPTFTVAGYSQLGSPAQTATDFGTSVTEIADGLTWLRGRHTWKMGFDLRWERLNVIQPSSPTGTFAFSTLFTDLPGTTGTGSGLASFLLGQVQTFSIDLQQAKVRNRAHIQEYFIQDDWHPTASTTVNAGVRYTLNFPSTEKDNQAAVFNLDTQQMEYLGRDGQPRSARELHKLDFGPRLGLAQKLGQRTVARAGYGVIWIEQAGITTPFTTPSFPFIQTVSQATLDNITPAFVLSHGPTVAPVPLTPDAGLGQGVFSVRRGLGSGYAQQWNVAVQRELTRDMSVEIAYVGSKITNVGLPDANINQLTEEQLSQGTALTKKVPNPYFGIIPSSSSLGAPTITVAQLMKPFPKYTGVSLYRDNTGTTNYQGLTAKLEQRLSRGLSYLVSYTRSHLVDDASSVFDASIPTGPVLNAPVADAFNRARDRDVSTGDIPHVFVASVVWIIPVGADYRRNPGGILGAIVRDWSASTIVTLQSGIPLAISQTTNNNAFAGFGTQRPNLDGDPTLPADQRTTAHWFNTAAFSAAPQFTLGSSSRNPVRGPGYRNVDLALSRRVPLDKGLALECRVEIFNITNTPPLSAPNTQVGSAAFGTIIAAGDPRVVQIAVKLLF